MRTIVGSGLIALTALLGAAASVAIASPATAGQAQTTASPARASELYGVSCASSKDCVAVGTDQNAYDGRGGPLTQTWNGKTWKTVPVKLPKGAVAGGLFSVSCASAAACVAVGFYLNGGGTGFPLAQTWNGTGWAPSTLVTPAGSVGVGLNGVSCAAAKSCVAVGYYLTRTGSAALAESWNGRKWTTAKPPEPKGSVAGDLNKVSCASATYCVAVGTTSTDTSSFVLADSWNGKAWAKMSAQPPASSKKDADLTGVSCTSAKSCVAVGGGIGAGGLTAFSELWNGKTWAAAKVSWPKGTSDSYLVGVSCGSAKSCVTVGYVDINVNDGGNTGRAAAASWNGKAWTATKVPAPAKGEASLFNDVSCRSATACVAAGQLGPYKSTEGSGLAGLWNGKSWALVTTP
jgi:hypothetical protein